MNIPICSRCNKNPAVVFVTKIENGETRQEGLCLQCAASLGLPQVEEMMRRMGITPEDLESVSNEMMTAFGGAEELEGMDESDEDEESGKTATFPFLNRLFGGQIPAALFSHRHAYGLPQTPYFSCCPSRAYPPSRPLPAARHAP